MHKEQIKGKHSFEILMLPVYFIGIEYLRKKDNR